MKLVDLATGSDWIVWIVFVIFAVFSIILLSGHGSWFISGYNTASKEEKEKYDSKALCKSTGKLMLSLVFCISLMLASEIFSLSFLRVIGGIGIPVCIIFYLIHARNGEKYRKSN